MKTKLLICSIVFMAGCASLQPSSEAKTRKVLEESFTDVLNSLVTLYEHDEISETDMDWIIALSTEIDDYLQVWSDINKSGGTMSEMKYRIEPLIEKLAIYLLEKQDE